MLELFHKIIKGHLRPHLISEDNLSEINDYLIVTLRCDKESNSLQIENEYMNLCLPGNGEIIEISIDKENSDNNTLTIRPDEGLEELFNLNIPPPPNEKSEIYLTVIEREASIIKAKIDLFLNAADDIESIKLFAFKNIQILKELAEHLRLYIKKLPGEHGNLFVTDANHFVLYVLKYYLIEIIQYIQKTFSPFTKMEMESETSLKQSLFHEFFTMTSSFIIFPLLPKEKEFEDLKKEYYRLNKLNERAIVPIGKFLFDYYKKKNHDLNREKQIENYLENVHFWNQLIIANELKVIIGDTYVNDPEIEKILIPLLENEITLLQLTKTKKQTILKGFDCQLSHKAIERIHAQMVVEKHIKAELEDFQAVFSNEVAYIKEPITWLIEYRNNGHKAALRDFLELMLGDINLDTITNKHKVKSFFTDWEKGMELNKKKNASNYFKTFEDLINLAKQKADH